MCLGFKVRETDWEQRDSKSRAAEVAMLWAARLFAVIPSPSPLQLLVRPPGLQEHSSCTEWHLLLCGVSPEAALMCLPCPWHPTQWVTFFIFPDLEFCLYKTNLCFYILIPTLPF